MFSLREVNQMEREMCNYLDWELTVDDPILTNFQKAVKRDFGDHKSTYPNYPTLYNHRQRCASRRIGTHVLSASAATYFIASSKARRYCWADKSLAAPCER
jgi:hypothetical protein